MADVTIKYKGTTIAEMNGAGNKTLNTSGKYCEGDIVVGYAPNCKTYDITLSKASGWVLLTTLDKDVMEHIDDPSFSVMFMCVDDYAYEFYAISMACCSNKSQAVQGSYPIYGLSIRQSSTTTTNALQMYYKPNNTTTDTSLGNAQFRVNSGKYYFRPSDGYVRAGNYRLTFKW